MGDTSFLFVQVSDTGKVAPGKALRKQIQRQAMKDTAAQRRQRTLHRRAQPEPSPATSSIGLVPRGSRIDPFVPYPVRVSPAILFLIDHVYTSSHSWVRPFRETWFPLSLPDSAFFYEILSNVSRQVNCLRAESGIETQHVDYHTLAVRSINQQISDPALAISDGVVGTILAFTCFAYSRRNWEEYQTHLQGLLAIIRLKGGANALNHNLMLRLLLSGIDVTTSCLHNGPLRFPLPLKARHDWHVGSREVPWWLPVGGEAVGNLWQYAFPSDNCLSDALRDMSTTVMVMRQELHRRQFWQDKAFMLEYVDPLSYRLLSSTVDLEAIDASNFMNECCRLAALILLSKIRRRFESRLVFTGIETRKLRKILQMHATDWIHFRPLLLWACILAAVEVADEEQVWFCNQIASTARLMGLASWDEVVTFASNLLWVGDLLDAEVELLRP